MHAAGVYESRGWFLGFLGGMDAALLGRYRGTSQSRLSRLLNPPRKLYFGPIVLWLFGFFILMSFDAQGKLSWEMAVLSVAYVLLLPAYLLGSLVYNLALVRRNSSSVMLCESHAVALTKARRHKIVILIVVNGG